jgi:hypothetical protein
MTLCLAQSLIDDHGVFNPQTAIRYWIAWYRDGYLSAIDRCFDIGNATRQALGVWSEYFQRDSSISTSDPNVVLQGQKEINDLLDRKV